MTRKFLFCFPLRLGNIVFGYIVIIISLAVIIYNLYQLGLDLVSTDEERDLQKFGNVHQLESIFGAEKKDLVNLTIMIYYLMYITIAFLLFVFATIFTCGAYNVNQCLVSTFFVYSFIHLFLTIGLIVWEAITAGWIQLGLILGTDLLLMVCLFSVKYLIEAIRTGNIYTRPEEVLFKY